MATKVYSHLANDGTFSFNPSKDTLVFDSSSISAADVSIFPDFENAGHTIFNTGIDNKEITLLANIARLTSSNVTFDDGSLLLVGDNKPGTNTAPDQANNKLTGGGGDDHLVGLGGNDTLIGGKGDDYLEGGEGNDRLDGGDGVEFFYDFYGSNTMLGGAGDDFFFADSGAGSANRATGGAGRDTYYAGMASVYSPINFNVTDFNSNATSGDVINISTVLTASAFFGDYQGQDPFTGGFVRVIQSGANALLQVDMDGSAGTFYEFATSLTLKNTNATLAHNTVGGYVLGGDGSDDLEGGASNEILFSGKGNDKLDGGAGADNLFGGSGSDTYIVDDGSDVVTESSNEPGGLVVGSGDDDHSAIDGFTDTVLASVNYSLEFAAFVENLRLTGTVAREATGNALNNSLTGNKLSNRLEGLGGDDVLNGGAGNDTVLGGEGNDKLFWGTGDLANGEAGVDTMKLSSSLDLTTLSNTRILGIERIDMIGGGSNVLKLAKSDVLALSTESDTLTVLGNSGDKVDVTTTHNLISQADGFKTYNLTGGALLIVETDVQVV